MSGTASSPFCGSGTSSNSFIDPNAPVTYHIPAPIPFSSLVVDAKEEFARHYVAPAIRANGRYQTAAYATTHLHGGAIMGDNPTTVDRYSR